MDACPHCMGTGLGEGPSRYTREDAPQKAVLSLLIACRHCEGHGVIPRGSDRDLTQLVSTP